MRLTVESTDEDHKIIIISKTVNDFIHLLKNHLQKYSNKIYLTPILPRNFESFDYYFFVNEIFPLEKLFTLSNKKICLIFINKEKKASAYSQLLIKHGLTNVKTISIYNGATLNAHNFQSLLWFALTSKHENFLRIKGSAVAATEKLTRGIPKNHPNKLKFTVSTGKIFLLGLLVFLAIHTAFFMPLIACSYFNLKAFQSIKINSQNDAIHYLNQSSYYLSLTQKLYATPRQTLLMFSLASFPDNLIQINEKLSSVINQYMSVQSQGKSISTLILKKDKTSDEIASTKKQISDLFINIRHLEDNLRFLKETLPDYAPQVKKAKLDIDQAIEAIKKIRALSPYMNYVFGDESERRYLLLFANNMELRPGGGFIGSFGILTVKNMTIHNIEIFDVYDADGQLEAHVEPPAAIREYLGQPHWFLRDSAFSGDFNTNYNQAKFFLEKEMNISDFSGGILLTTSTIKSLLHAFDSLYLSDFGEPVTADNFYIKAQLYSEKGFFPGSTQKKNFLGSLARHMLIDLENASTVELFRNLKKSLDEKQMVMYFENPELQKIMDSFYWSGQIIEPYCPPNLTNCMSDFLLPLDANLGVNKANFFINRTTDVNVRINSTGTINTVLTIKYKNEAETNVFPGGTYRNYFQLLLPPEVVIKKITLNDTLVEKYDEENARLKTIGFLVQTQPLAVSEIKISYEHPVSIVKGRGYYQLIMQKQTGATNSDISLRVSLPQNIKLLNQNFTPLVKDSQIIYNTQLVADKIFFIELLKE